MPTLPKSAGNLRGRRDNDVRAPAHRIEERHAPVGEVRTAQLNILAGFSLYSGATQVVCAAVFVLLAWPIMPMPALLSWLALVIGATYMSVRWLANTTQIRRDDEQPASKIQLAVLDNFLRAAIWISMPVYATLNGVPVSLTLAGGLIVVVMIVSGISVAVIPAAVIAWITVLTGGFGFAIWMTAESAVYVETAVLGAVAATSLAGFLLLARFWHRQIHRTAVLAAKRADIGSLLQEYEDRGAGWLWQVDAQFQLTYVSPRMGELMGQGTYQLLGHSLPQILDDPEKLGQILSRKKRFDKYEMKIEGQKVVRWVTLSGSPITDKDGEFAGFRGVGLDITESKSSHQRLQRLANMDVLTGLPNRAHVRTILGEALERGKANSVPCAILFLDLDGFKPVNDTFGHPKGDAVLKTVSRRLKDAIGSKATVGRIGGDEFAVVVEDASSRLGIEDLANRLIQIIGQPYVIDNIQIRIGLSIGCAFGPIDGVNVDDLVRKADLALYHAKARGRGTFCSFEPQMQVEAEDRVRLEHDMRQAIGSDQFSLMYQPLVSSRTQRVEGFEALLRWNHPTRGFVSPASFIPIAEESGLIEEMGEWVLKRACLDAANWPEDITVAVNVSPLQLVVPALPNAVSNALKLARIAPTKLEVEVTESVFMSSAGNSLDVLKRLRGIGVGIALDDFGTGYSSLGYLNKAVFHKLKIDHSFVRDAATRDETVSIIKAIVMLANSFRLSITAEGIETAEDFNRMRDLGCDLLQGYLFGKPMPFEKTLEIVGTKWEHRLVG
ncbi:bifunctional diguanylate cyclase/phosphodiesterase [uncultured Parasphingopyxis sp.]|uniref:putative bifunctional diguanylate cyclase/phosphodiesterase n=1 Tax=uncultured Parasphingopyxis sp. TaxID=1547918 RepID=UPI002623CDB8|nr:GGDEF and EAL domain-containing protein [uncultured Parasphingopyxis sp.]